MSCPRCKCFSCSSLRRKALADRIAAAHRKDARDEANGVPAFVFFPEPRPLHEWLTDPSRQALPFGVPRPCIVIRAKTLLHVKLDGDAFKVDLETWDLHGIAREERGSVDKGWGEPRWGNRWVARSDDLAAARAAAPVADAARIAATRQARADRVAENYRRLNETPAGKARIATLRKRVQASHPDLGGDPAEFREAMRELDRARGLT